MSEHDGLMHNHLSNYKRSQGEEVRRTFTLRLAALVAAFLDVHCAKGCIPPFDRIATVPSARRNAPATIINRIAKHKNQPDALTYVGTTLTATAPAGCSVLLFDDTLTSGETVSEARDKLTQAKVKVVDVVVIGRHVNASRDAESKELLKRLKDHAWDLNACGRCAGLVFDPPLQGEPVQLFPT